MKITGLYLLILILLLLLLGSCATDKMAYISKDCEIYVTWLVSNYEKYHIVPKVSFHPNGMVNFYSSYTATEPNLHGSFVITNKWFDQKGNVWYTIILTPDFYGNQRRYELLKLSDSGQTLEIDWSTTDYPKEIIPDPVFHSGYHIAYRE
jgi:hypothetical protein